MLRRERTCDSCGAKISSSMADFNLINREGNAPKAYDLCADCGRKILNEFELVQRAMKKNASTEEIAYLQLGNKPDPEVKEGLKND